MLNNEHFTGSFDETNPGFTPSNIGFAAPLVRDMIKGFPDGNFSCGVLDEQSMKTLEDYSKQHRFTVHNLGLLYLEALDNPEILETGFRQSRRGSALSKQPMADLMLKASGDAKGKSVLLIGDESAALYGNEALEDAEKLTLIAEGSEATRFAKLRSALRNEPLDIREQDILEQSMSPEADLVFFDIPFGKLNRNLEPIAQDHMETISYDVFSGRRLDGPYVTKAINAAAKDGTIVVSVPTSLLFDRLNLKFRKQLINRELVKKVILLPPGIKRAGEHSALLVMEKNNKSEDVGFLDLSKEGSTLKREERIRNFIERIESIKPDDFERIPLQKIEANEYNLNPDYYRNLEAMRSMPNPKELSRICDILPGMQRVDRNIHAKGEIGLLSLQNVEDDGVVSLETERYLDPQDLKSDQLVLQNGDILMTSNGSYVRFGLVDGLGERKFIPAHGLTILRAKGISPYYLMAYLNSESGREYFKNLVPGKRVVHFTAKDLAKVRIPVPEAAIQDKMAASFKEGFEKMKQAKKDYEKYRDQNAALFLEFLS